MTKKTEKSTSETVSKKESESDIFNFPASDTLREKAKRITRCVLNVLLLTRFCRNKKKHKHVLKRNHV